MAATSATARRRLVALAMLIAPVCSAAELGEDRADILYHAYDGGGVTVDGPSVLVRKTFKEKVSLSANYYVDMVSSASIDVLTQGSPYEEKRTEYSVGVDYLHNKSTLSLNYANSSESDYEAETVSFGISQDFFGDLTTLTMGYAYGSDWVGRNRRDDGAITQTDYIGDIKRHRYNLGLTQVLTKSWIMAFNFESVVDDGFPASNAPNAPDVLSNPYRSYRFIDDGDEQWRDEIYPSTRNSDAAAIRTLYYLPYRAALRFEARTFSDSWGILASNYELRYTHPLNEQLTLSVKGRHYQQTQADFYRDDFGEADTGTSGREFRGRDKELSTYDSLNLGLGVTYEFQQHLPYTQRQSLSLFWDFMQFDYENYRNAYLSEGSADNPRNLRPAKNPVTVLRRM